MMHLVKLFSSLLIMVSFLFGCSPHEDKAENLPLGPSTPVVYTEITKGAYTESDNTQPDILKITQPTVWQTFWQNLYRHVSPIPAIPQIDFDKNMVLAIVDVSQGTPPLTFSLTSLSKTDNYIIAEVVRELPGETCMMAQTLGQPYIVLETPTLPQKPMVKVSSQTMECE